ncbi:MAG: FtsX-like permease family protein, partial [Cytophagaceae bacterium]
TEDFVVSGVLAPIPPNSTLQFDYLRSFDSFAKKNPWVVADWSDYGPTTVVMLRSDASLEKVNTKIRGFLTQHDKTIEDKTLSLQPYGDQYLYARFEQGLPVGGRIDYVRLFSVVALVILLIACINFVNLATARSVKRAKEIGVRKVVGAARSYLVGQFMGESFLMTLLAASLAMLLAFLLLPTFNLLTGKELSIPLDTPIFWAKLVLLLGLTTILAGTYPALFLSSFNPINVLKGSLATKPGSATVRQGLVIVQFTLALLLVTGTFIVYQQMDYIQTKHIGLDRDHLLYIKLDGDLPKNYDLFKQTVLQSSAVETVTTLNTVPTDVGNATSDVIWPAKSPADKFSIWLMGASYDFVKTLHITLKEGREFSPTFRTDTAGFLLNEAAVELMHLKNPVGQPLSLWGKNGRVIGIMKNFHLQSLHHSIEPLLVYYDAQHRGNLTARIRADQAPQALSILQKAYKAVNPQYAFTYEFADDAYQQQYKSESVIQELATYLACLALIISCLGLFGLATFMTEQRTKEIGVRKVLGASVDNLVGLLSKDFLKLVLISLLVASPLAWYALNQWLAGFAYRITIHWWVFALAGLPVVGIALLTVSYQTLKVALMNPINSLRSE